MMLVKGSNVFAIDKDTLEPEIIRTETTDDSGFMNNGYYYEEKVIYHFN